jgi:hypothetical protein
MSIDSPLWFLGALLICGWHTRFLLNWRREQREYRAWWQKHDTAAQQRHGEFMHAFDRSDSSLEWNLDGSRERGQA